MGYTNFNKLGLSDGQVEEIKDCISRHVGLDEAQIDDKNLQFVIYERINGTESRGFLLRVKTTSARFHFFVNLWRRPRENGRLKLRAYLEDQGACGWQFHDADIVLSVKNKKGDATKGNVFYFVPSDFCHCKRFSAIAFYEYRESVGRLARSILDKLNEVNYFTADYSNCRLAEEGDAQMDIPEEVNDGVSVLDGYQELLQKNGGIDPAIVQVDAERWLRQDYGAEVRDLSAVEPGVLSWVSTVEEIAKKAAVKVKGVLVKPAKLRIPPYQRKFAWKERDVRRLCRDLIRVKARDEEHYHLGTIILHHERKGDEEIWNVVDGQQRLTNIWAILRAPIFEGQIKQFQVRDHMMICQVLSEYSDEDQAKIRERLASCTLAFISVEKVSEAFQLFTTQNGRGKPLTPVNLLKAYHYKEMDADRLRMNPDEFDQLQKSIEREWESANVAAIATAPGDGKLLLHVFREYLFRLRLWSRGKFPQLPFNMDDIAEFKGVTVRNDGTELPLQNGAVLRASAAKDREFVAHRHPDDRTNPYVSIGQTIVNGSDFFEYAQSYVMAYRDVFMDGKVPEFYAFYIENCKPKVHRSGAAMYARHVFEALCMFCYDRFGFEGLQTCHRSLFACAYYERVSQTRVLYRRCGSTYAPKAIEAMLVSYSVADVQEALNELRSEIRSALNSCDYTKELCKKTNLTRGETMQRSAYETILK